MKSKIKRLLALVLCLTMILNGNVSLLASDEATVEDQVVAEAVEEMMEEVAEEATEETIEEVTEEVVEEVVEETPEEAIEEVNEETEVVEQTTEVQEVVKEVSLLELTWVENGVTVKVSEKVAGAIPEGATLSVTPIIEGDEYTDVETQLQEKAANEEYEIAGFLAYDICLVDAEGNEIEPNDNVNVSIEYDEAVIPEMEVAEDAVLDVTVIHFEEDGNGEVIEIVDMVAEDEIEATVKTTEVAEVEKVEFVTDSFSIFTITWNNTSRSITFKYVDTAGNEISSSQFKNDESFNLSNKTWLTIAGSDYAPASVIIDGNTYNYKEARIKTVDGEIVARVRYDDNKAQYSTSENSGSSDWGDGVKIVYLIYEQLYSFSVYNVDLNGNQISGNSTTTLSLKTNSECIIEDNASDITGYGYYKAVIASDASSLSTATEIISLTYNGSSVTYKTVDGTTGTLTTGQNVYLVYADAHNLSAYVVDTNGSTISGATSPVSLGVTATNNYILSVRNKTITVNSQGYVLNKAVLASSVSSLSSGTEIYAIKYIDNQFCYITSANDTTWDMIPSGQNIYLMYEKSVSTSAYTSFYWRFYTDKNQDTTGVDIDATASGANENRSHVRVTYDTTSVYTGSTSGVVSPSDGEVNVPYNTFKGAVSSKNTVAASYTSENFTTSKADVSTLKIPAPANNSTDVPGTIHIETEEGWVITGYQISCETTSQKGERCQTTAIKNLRVELDTTGLYKSDFDLTVDEITEAIGSEGLCFKHRSGYPYYCLIFTLAQVDANIKLNKTVDKSTCLQGDTLTYTLVAKNINDTEIDYTNTVFTDEFFKDSNVTITSVRSRNESMKNEDGSYPESAYSSLNYTRERENSEYTGELSISGTWEFGYDIVIEYTYDVSEDYVGTLENIAYVSAIPEGGTSTLKDMSVAEVVVTVNSQNSGSILVYKQFKNLLPSELNEIIKDFSITISQSSDHDSDGKIGSIKFVYGSDPLITNKDEFQTTYSGNNLSAQGLILQNADPSTTTYTYYCLISGLDKNSVLTVSESGYEEEDYRVIANVSAGEIEDNSGTITPLPLTGIESAVSGNVTYTINEGISIAGASTSKATLTNSYQDTKSYIRILKVWKDISGNVISADDIVEGFTVDASISSDSNLGSVTLTKDDLSKLSSASSSNDVWSEFITIDTAWSRDWVVTETLSGENSTEWMLDSTNSKWLDETYEQTFTEIEYFSDSALKNKITKSDAEALIAAGLTIDGQNITSINDYPYIKTYNKNVSYHQYLLTNIPATTSINIEKVWIDYDNNYNTRVVEEGNNLTEITQISVKLQKKAKDANVSPTDVEGYNNIVVEKDNNWKTTVDGLPISEVINGSVVELEYNVVENDVPVGYAATYTDDGNGNFVVTNTLKWDVVKKSSKTPLDGTTPLLLLKGAEFELRDRSDSSVKYYGESLENGEVLWTTGDPNEKAEPTIADGSYTLVETKAPAGYALNINPLDVTVVNGLMYINDYQSNTKLVKTYNDQGKLTNQVLTFYFDNTALYELPSSGSYGIYMYMTGGVMLMAFATFVLYKNRRKEVLVR